HQCAFDQLWFPYAKSDVRAAAAGVLRKTNTAMGEELSGLDPPDRIFHQLAEFAALLVSDLRTQILHFDQALADEDDLCDFGDAGDPRVANQLWIESEQPLGFFRGAAGRGFPLQHGTSAVQVS